MFNIKPGEIVYCNLHFKTKVGTKEQVVIVEKQVFGREYVGEIQTEYKLPKDDRFLNKMKLKSDSTLVKIDIIKSLGYKN